MPDGVYSVHLLFAETYQGACEAGKRVFDIELGTPISGTQPVVEKFDVFSNAGCKTAHIQRFENVPSKEGIVLLLRRRTQHPSLAAVTVEGYPKIAEGQAFPTPIGRGIASEAESRTSGEDLDDRQEDPLPSERETFIRGRRRLLSAKKAQESKKLEHAATVALKRVNRGLLKAKRYSNRSRLKQKRKATRGSARIVSKEIDEEFLIVKGKKVRSAHDE